MLSTKTEIFICTYAQGLTKRFRMSLFQAVTACSENDDSRDFFFLLKK